MNADTVTYCNPTRLLCAFHSHYKGCDIWKQYDPVNACFLPSYWSKHGQTILHATSLDRIRDRITEAVSA